ncbi:hypothetical protein QEG98_30240 [Myxococcus sp. MxC21-1]|uniref:hypothetical protein n=1 Tax=Myxococcus sp. MxC21-1 TaxID=3041439 RepID=UPI00292F12FB|nr:hypothetical protein [Myxococcus sp. MxC21-1]WNZ60255.1 hypothetical protein QEG98_30240 [Myxococcus sp. MxC21-1]
MSWWTRRRPSASRATTKVRSSSTATPNTYRSGAGMACSSAKSASPFARPARVEDE